MSVTINTRASSFPSFLKSKANKEIEKNFYAAGEVNQHCGEYYITNKGDNTARAKFCIKAYDKKAYDTVIRSNQTDEKWIEEKQRLIDAYERNCVNKQTRSYDKFCGSKAMKKAYSEINN